MRSRAAVLAVVAFGATMIGPVGSSGIAQAAPNCAGETPTHFGTSGNDVIYGTNGRDVIVGGAGDDVLVGLGGDDVICGQAGRDIIRGGSGNDRLYGGDGNDKISGNDGADRIYGKDGYDELYGGPGNDKLLGGPGNDLLEGRQGTDKMYGHGGADILDGGAAGGLAFGGPGLDTCLSSVEQNNSCEPAWLYWEIERNDSGYNGPYASTPVETVDINGRTWMRGLPYRGDAYDYLNEYGWQDFVLGRDYRRFVATIGMLDTSDSRCEFRFELRDETDTLIKTWTATYGQSKRVSASVAGVLKLQLRVTEMTDGYDYCYPTFASPVVSANVYLKNRPAID